MTLLRLFPEPGRRPARGTYLDERLIACSDGATPFVYANFLSTLDGRIATSADSRSGYATPPHSRSSLDWLLFRELQAQADCLLTHTGYLRSLASGELGDVLSLPEDHDTHYLHTWRRAHGLPGQPMIVVVSRSLDFDTAVLPGDRSRVHILTGSGADTRRLAELDRAGWQLHQLPTVRPDAGSEAGSDTGSDAGLIDARDVVTLLQRLGSRSTYLQTGPDMLHSMLRGGYLRRLYLTLHLSMAGGDDFLSMVRGPRFVAPPHFRVDSLYLGGSAMQQLFLTLSAMT